MIETQADAMQLLSVLQRRFPIFVFCFFVFGFLIGLCLYALVSGPAPSVTATQISAVNSRMVDNLIELDWRRTGKELTPDDVARIKKKSELNLISILEANGYKIKGD